MSKVKWRGRDKERMGEIPINLKQIFIRFHKVIAKYWVKWERREQARARGREGEERKWITYTYKSIQLSPLFRSYFNMFSWFICSHFIIIIIILFFMRWNKKKQMVYYKQLLLNSYREYNFLRETAPLRKQNIESERGRKHITYFQIK